MKVKSVNLGIGVQIFKSFSDESRIRILNIIFHHGEACIADLEMVLGFTQTKTSRHLAFLRNAGLTTPRRVDQFVYYSLNEQVATMVAQLFKFLGKDAHLQKDLEQYQILYSNRELAASRMDLRKMAEQRF